MARYRQPVGNGGDEVWIREENTTLPAFLLLTDDIEIYFVYSGEVKFSNSQPRTKLKESD
jgi:hypothetical protein